MTEQQRTSINDQNSIGEFLVSAIELRPIRALAINAMNRYVEYDPIDAADVEQVSTLKLVSRAVKLWRGSHSNG